jgi:putative ABC transport system permease protein
VQAILFGVSSLDTASFVVGPLLLVPVALTACLLPALRASRADPVVTLRSE